MTPIGISMFLGLLFLGDIVATFLYIRYIRHRFPRINYKEFEVNMFVRWAWEKFGFYRGTLLAPLILSPFWLVVVFASLNVPYFIYMVVGMYMLLYVLHYSNLSFVLSNKETNFSRMYDKIYGGKK